MDHHPEFSLRWEWEPAPLVRAAEHRATWARLEIWVGSECVTLVEDRESQSSRRSIYCSLYPLAEWIAFNWWFLRADARPIPELIRTSLRTATQQADERSRLQRHNLQSAGDGFAWPYLLVVPEGGSTRLAWRRDRSPSPGRPVRFLSHGEAVLDNQVVDHVLSSLVEAVLTRLAEQGVTNTALEKEWSEVTTIDEDEEEFCLAAARLGLDPYSEAVAVEADILRAAEELRGNVFGDFLDAVSPRRIGAGLDWISNADRLIQRSARRVDERLSGLRKETSRRWEADRSRPWEVGWRQASEVRRLLGIAVGDVFRIDELVDWRMRPVDDRSLQAVGGTVSEAAPIVVLGRQQPRETKRFTLARGLWHVLYEDERLFLVTSAYTDRQKTERAFAAELLAPARGVAERIEGPLDVIASEDVEQVAQHFRVSPMVVEHQVENQLSATIVG
jgi:hypothetical protein